MNIHIPQNTGNLLTNEGTTTLSRMALLHGVSYVFKLVAVRVVVVVIVVVVVVVVVVDVH
jgi:hypothetical protein